MPTTIDLTSFSSGFVIQGTTFGDYSGFSASGALELKFI